MSLNMLYSTMQVMVIHTVLLYCLATLYALFKTSDSSFPKNIFINRINS